VHAFMQDRDNTDATVGEHAPVDEMVLVPAIKAIDPEVGRYRSPQQFAPSYPIETRE